MDPKRYSAREEQRLLDALGRGLLREFPNPERSGCPDAEILKGIASRTMSLNEAEKWLNHLGSCSPCYSDFSALRKAHEFRRRRTVLAIAATVLVAAGITGWFLVQRHNEGLSAQTVVLDLRNRSIPRGTETNPTEPPLVVSRSSIHWNIYLPLGSSEGSYEVRIVTDKGVEALLSTSEAKLLPGIASLPIEVNLASARPGRYNLEIRKTGKDWNSFPIILK